MTTEPLPAQRAGTFNLGGDLTIKEFGLALSVAVFVDAFIIRTALVPALMHLFGTANWWLPGWLDRAIPRRSTAAADLATPAPGLHVSDDPGTT